MNSDTTLLFFPLLLFFFLSGGDDDGFSHRLRGRATSVWCVCVCVFFPSFIRSFFLFGRSTSSSPFHKHKYAAIMTRPSFIYFPSLSHQARFVQDPSYAGTDPDDKQSLVHALWYSDMLDIRGIIPSWHSMLYPDQTQSAVSETYLVIDRYEQGMCERQRDRKCKESSKEL